MSDCTGPGLDIDPTGRVVLVGPRSEEWPEDCDIAALNGLRTDPVTGDVWAPPDLEITRAEHTGAGRFIIPPDTNPGTLHILQVEHTADCRPCHVQLSATGGFAGFRMASGNFWVVRRRFTTYVNGSPVATTGLEPIAVCENNSGGVVSQGTVCDSAVYGVLLDAGDTIRFNAYYELEPAALVSNAANGFTWRPPDVRLAAWTVLP